MDDDWQNMNDNRARKLVNIRVFINGELWITPDGEKRDKFKVSTVFWTK
jgi:hypothetical protein